MVCMYNKLKLYKMCSYQLIVIIVLSALGAQASTFFDNNYVNRGTPPNIIFILTDDQDVTLNGMVNLLRRT